MPRLVRYSLLTFLGASLTNRQIRSRGLAKGICRHYLHPRLYPFPYRCRGIKQGTSRTSHQACYAKGRGSSKAHRLGQGEGIDLFR
jgi:hypothetical protein